MYYAFALDKTYLYEVRFLCHSRMQHVLIWCTGASELNYVRRLFKKLSDSVYSMS